jgi:hypothetical protein
MLPKYAECYDIQRDHNGRRNIQLHIMHVCTASSVFADQSTDWNESWGRVLSQVVSEKYKGFCLDVRGCWHMYKHGR